MGRQCELYTERCAVPLKIKRSAASWGSILELRKQNLFELCQDRACLSPYLEFYFRILQAYAALNFILQNTHLAFCHKQNSLKQMECTREVSTEQGVPCKSPWPLYFSSLSERMVHSGHQAELQIQCHHLLVPILSQQFVFLKEIHKTER